MILSKVLKYTCSLENECREILLDVRVFSLTSEHRDVFHSISFCMDNLFYIFYSAVQMCNMSSRVYGGRVGELQKQERGICLIQCWR